MPVRLSCAAACLVALACGDGRNPGAPGGAAYRLALVGSAALVLHPGETRALQVVLAKDQVGGVPDARIHFELVGGDLGGARIEAPLATTGAQGVARVSFTAGTRTASLKLVASAPHHDAREVAFTIDVVPVRKLLQVLDSPGAVVAQDGQSATLTLSASSSAALRVREIDADTGAAIARDPIWFALPASVQSTFGSGAGKPARATTNAAGEAQVFLYTGAREPGFQVTALPATGGAPVYFNVVVQEERAPPCTSDEDCPAGRICSGGRCRDGGASCGIGAPCPVGYECMSGVCLPPPGPVPCEPACRPGTHCNLDTRRCDPDPPALPDATGVWYTKHVFSLRDSLPAPLQQAFKFLRGLDQLLTGQLGLPSWLQGIVDAILGHFLPEWFHTLVRIGDDLGTVLSYVRAEGRMRLSRESDAVHLKGTEMWSSLVFYWLPLCGDAIAGDPEVPPECARLDVTTTDSGIATEPARCKGETLPVAVQAAPFSATVEPVAGSSPARYRLRVERRRVDLEIGKAVLSAAGAMMSLTTPWRCIDEAADCTGGRQCIVDCAGIGQWVSDFTAGFFDPGTMERACAGAVGLAGRTATRLLGSVKLETEALEFDGHASIGAGQLGTDSFDGDLRHRPAVRDGAWTGVLPGAWEAKRAHF